MPALRPSRLAVVAPAALRAAAALGAGLCLWQAWPRGDRWYLAVVGVALLALATRGRRGRAGLGLGVLAGLAAFLPSLSWSGIYVGALPWVALATLEALYVGLTGAAHARLTRRHRPSPAGRPDAVAPDAVAPDTVAPDTVAPEAGATAAGPAPVRPVVLATAWTAGEWLRSTTPFGGFPWNKIAYSQADSPMLSLARWLSSTGLTFAVALAGGLLAVAVLRAWRWATARGRASAGAARRDLLVAAGATGALVAVVAGPALVPVPTGGPTAEVLGIQGDVPTAGLDFNAQRRAVLDHHVAQTLLAAQEVAARTRPQPDLVVWPENASDIDPLRNADAGALIGNASRQIGAPILVGGLRIDDAGRVENTSWYWQGDQGPTQSYAKRHPVPFGEYIPYRSFFRRFSDKVDLVTQDMVAGSRVGIMTGPTVAGGVPVRVGLGICFEVAYDDVLLDTLDAGANLLAVQTNNATFGYTAESYQQLAISRVRAVEYGRSVVHVSTVGTSALITPDGVPHLQSGLFEPARLSMALPLRTERTPAAVLGLWPGRAATAALAVLLLVDVVRRTSRRRRRTAGRSPGARGGAARTGATPTV